MASAASSPVPPGRLPRGSVWTTLTITLSTSVLAGVAGCASEPAQPPPPRPAAIAAPAPSGPVAPAGRQTGAQAAPATTPAARPAPTDDELPPAPVVAPDARDDARERDERIAQLEREARAGSRGAPAGGSAPLESAPRGSPARDDRPAGRGDPARRDGDPDVDPALDALLTRANQAVQDRQWSAYSACFSAESQRLLASSWAVAAGVAAWVNDQKPDKNSKGIAKILWLTVGKCGVTRASIVEVAEGRTTPRAALDAHRQASRDPRRAMEELGPSLPFAEHEAFLGRARLDAPRGKGAGATVQVRAPDGVTVVELQHGPTGDYVLHIQDTEAWLTRLDRALSVRIAAKE